MQTMMDSLLKLTRLGARPCGSPANQAAADFIRQTFASAGLEVEEQPYSCTAWEEEETLLEWNGERLEATANAFSLPCDARSALVCAGTIAELETLTARGKILLLYGDLTRNPLSAKSWFLKDERDDRVIQLLEALQPAAIIAPPTATDYYGQFTEDWELDIPAATVPPAVARKLMRNADSPVRVKISARRISAQARNIVARKKGRESGRVVLCAHFDTKINTPGASDNAAAVAVLLELASRLAGREPRFTLEFIAFNNEEYLPLGDDEYWRRAEAYLSEIRCALNMDGVGAMLASASVTALSMPAEIESQMKQILADFPGVTWVEPWYESNHSLFAMRGIPALALGAVGERNIAHQPYNDAEGISPAKMEEVARLAEALLAKLETAL